MPPRQKDANKCLQDIPAVLLRCLFYPHPPAPSGFFPARAFFGARDIRAQYLSEKWHWSFRVIFKRIIFERYLSEQYLREEGSGEIRHWNWGRAKTSVWVLGKHAKIADSGRANFSGPKRKLVFGAHEKIGSATKYLRETFGRRARAKYLVFVFGGRGNWYLVSGECENAGAGAGRPREN